jgi:CRISPR-associated protein Csb2
MATILRITLLSGRYGATPWDRSEFEGQVEYPPSPWRLLRAVLHGAFTLSIASPARDQLPQGLAEIVASLASDLPSYHLPFGEFGQIRGFRPIYGGEAVPPLAIAASRISNNQGKRRSFIDSFLQLGAGSAIHVSWGVDLSPEQRSLLSDCLAGLSYLGRAEYPALWQLVPTMPAANCTPDPQGTLQVLGGGGPGLMEGLLMNAQTARGEGRQELPGQQWHSYRYSPDRPGPRLGGAAAPDVTRALYAVIASHPLSARTGLAWTDRLHRALLQRAPSSSLFSGMVAGQPLAEDQRAWYRWHEQDGMLTALEVISPQPFVEQELEAIQGLQRLYAGSSLMVPLQLMRLDAASPSSARRLTTATPMLLYTTPRDGKLQRYPAGQAIQSLLWGLGEQGKLDPGRFQQIDNAIAVDHPQHGVIRARLLQVIDQPTFACRGERKAASSLGFQIDMECERPLTALGVGWGRHFGAGRLEAVP